MKRILIKGILPIVVLTLLACAFHMGYQLGKPVPKPTTASTVTYTCPMHPQVNLPEDVPCPICKMALVPAAGGDGSGERELILKGRALKLAEIETAPAELRFVTRRIRMRGKVDFDETRLGTISAYVGGRVDKLLVNYTGLPVKAGAPLVLLYSPTLFTAQEELLEAKRQLGQATESSPFLRQSSSRTLASAREKLRLLGLDNAQVEAIEKSGQPQEHILIKAPLSGIVIRKEIRVGDYLRRGQKLFQIADLSQLWVRLDAYEMDLPWLRYGQQVTITTRAWPGKEFKGRISFIDPVLDHISRTVKVRVVVENHAGRLKPGMFARAHVSSRLSREGKVALPELAGKWISPTHPNIIRDNPGKCPECGLPLMRAADLGYLDRAGDGTRPLVIPATAVLRTGVRSLVYVKKPNTAEPTFEGRNIRVGPRADDYWIVLSGLQPGEQVVIKGNFKIDSAMQLVGKPSMMSAPGQETPSPPRARVNHEFRLGLGKILAAYFDLWLTLSNDDQKGAAASASLMRQRLGQMDSQWLEFMDRPDWRRETRFLDRFAGEIEQAENIATARSSFAPLSDSMTKVVTIFGNGGRELIYRVHCPMAFDNRGGWWLQSNNQIRNPYFGAAMLKCGTVELTFNQEKVE